MFLDQAGEIIADIMVVNRALSSVPSASAILDTSNYTFQAVTFGKDSEGFKNHAHKIINPSGVVSIKVISYDSPSVSGYHTSSTSRALSDYYSLLPTSPNPIDSRLEYKSTLPNYSQGVPDLGHCLNSVIHPELSTVSHLVGCFPASGGTRYEVYTSSNSLIFSGTFSSHYNKNSLMDASGFLTFANVAASTHETYSAANNYSQGCLRVPTNNPVLGGRQVSVKILVTSGDAGSLLLYGGIYHLGLWCLDIKQMLKEGNYPPYSFNALNNKRRYKLFAKKTFNKDLLAYSNETFSTFNTFKDRFENGVYINGVGTIITWEITF
jgi:hypothetical protein